MDLRDIFAANLRRLRHEKGLAQDDLDYEAGVSRSYLSQLEKGVHGRQRVADCQLRESFAVSAEEIRGGDDQRAHMQAGQGFEDRIEIAFTFRRENMELQPGCASGFLRETRRGLGNVRDSGVNQESDAGS